MPSMIVIININILVHFNIENKNNEAQVFWNRLPIWRYWTKATLRMSILLSSAGARMLPQLGSRESGRRRKNRDKSKNNEMKFSNYPEKTHIGIRCSCYKIDIHSEWQMRQSLWLFVYYIIIYNFEERSEK